MSPKQRRYLILVGCIGPAVANAFFNGLIGWLITVAIPNFPIWSIPGVAIDLVATAGGVAFGTCIAMVMQVKRDYRRGKITAPPVSSSVYRVLALIPKDLLKQSIAIGVLSVPLFALPVLLILLLTGVDALDRVTFTLLKTGLSGLESVLITPFIVLNALLDLSGPSVSEPLSDGSQSSDAGHVSI